LKNPLKAKLKTGKNSVGIVIGISHPDITELAATMGFDWMILDTEHSPYDVESTQVLMQAASYNPNFIPLIRVPWNDMVVIKKALDIGAYGVIIPWVNNREEAENAMKYCMYPPKGIRGCGPHRAALHDPEYIQTANDEILVGIQIETKAGVENLDEILSVEGIDICMIGPLDLSLSLGHLGQFEHPKLLEAFDRILNACENYGVVPGMFCSPQFINGALEHGFRFCSLTPDSWAFVVGMQTAIDNVKGWKPTPLRAINLL